MSKPICVIYFPDEYVLGRDRHWIYDYMRYLNGEKDGIEGQMRPSDYWKDYYWFCFYKFDIHEPEIKVFHEKDFTEIQYQELKELVINSLPKNNTNA